MDENEIDIPQYFLCPISLQIMSDPVTALTGITYDRKSINQWLNTTATATCPVTKQPLPRGSDLTPNHVLRKLIQAWCIANASSGLIDLIPTSKSTVQRSLLIKLIRDVNNNNDVLHALKKMEELANESDENRKSMAEAGVGKAMVLFVLKCFKEGNYLNLGIIEQALRIFKLTWNIKNKKIVEDNLDFVQSLLWILNNSSTTNDHKIQNMVLMVLNIVVQVASSGLLERLNLDFYKQMVAILRRNTNRSTTLALQILIQTCVSGRNKTRIVEAEAVFELIEIELRNPVEKKITELVFSLLTHLCGCADGRQQLLRHAGGLAVVAKRMLRVSPTTDDRALCVIESIARFSATREVVAEMLRVSVVSKLCMVIQADCAGYLKKKAGEILRLHSKGWSNSRCIQVYLLTWCPPRIV